MMLMLRWSESAKLNRISLFRSSIDFETCLTSSQGQDPCPFRKHQRERATQVTRAMKIHWCPNSSGQPSSTLLLGSVVIMKVSQHTWPRLLLKTHAFSHLGKPHNPWPFSILLAQVSFQEVFFDTFAQRPADSFLRHGFWKKIMLIRWSQKQQGYLWGSCAYPWPVQRLVCGGGIGGTVLGNPLSMMSTTPDLEWWCRQQNDSMA